MSTIDQTYKIPTLDWNNLSNEQISSLFLYGTLTPPTDLNDRIRPVSATGDQIGNDPRTAGAMTPLAQIWGNASPVGDEEGNIITGLNNRRDVVVLREFVPDSVIGNQLSGTGTTGAMVDYGRAPLF